MACTDAVNADTLAAELGEMVISNLGGEDNESQASTNKRDVPVTEVRGWSVEQVCDWLRSRGLSALEGSFVENDITGAELLSLDTNDRLQLGISQVGVRKRFEEAIELLRQGEPSGREAAEAEHSEGSSAEDRETGPVKLFVGQVPREATCEDLRALLEEFGQVIEAVVLRDKFTGDARGCGFVKLLSREAAEAAIQTLHNQRAMHPNHSLLQVQYARGEARGGGGGGGVGGGGVGEHKLFVGQLPKEVSDEEVRQLFAVYGELIEVCLLRHPNGSSKGCCFVKYTQRESALRAIQALGGVRLLPGAAAPLNIEFAESRREKWAKKAHRGQVPLGLAHMPPNPYALGMFPFIPHQMPQPQPPALPPMMPPNHPGGPLPPSSFPGPPQPFPMPNMGPGPFPGGVGVFPMGGAAMYPPAPGIYVGGMPYGGQQMKPDGAMHMGGGGGGFGGDVYGGRGNMRMGGGGGGGGGAYYEDLPPGCEVQVFNLHRDLSEWDLVQMFGVFGAIMSMRVMLDRQGRSKGHALVGFDNPEAAAAAVAQMNNMDVRGRKISVQLLVAKAASG